MLILPTNNAFERHVRIGIIGLLKQIARGKNPPVRVRCWCPWKTKKQPETSTGRFSKETMSKIPVAVSIYGISRNNALSDYKKPSDSGQKNLPHNRIDG